MGTDELRFCIGRSDFTVPEISDVQENADISVRAHEAGHILVALLSGFAVVKTTLGKTSHDSVTVCSYCRNSAPGYWELALVTCAGKAAEKLFFCMPSDAMAAGAVEDRTVVRNLLKKLLVSSDPNAEVDAELCRYKLDSVAAACEEEVSKLLFQHYTALHSLSELLNRGTLAGTEILSWANSFPALSSYVTT